jgi:hypothetical protein
MAGSGTVSRNPIGQGVTVNELPVNEFVFGCFGNDFSAYGVPVFENFFDFREFPGERPRLVNVVFVAMGENPTAVRTAF